MDPQLVNGPLAEILNNVGLIDHHVHGALHSTPALREWEALVTEAPRAPAVGSIFDSQVGFAIRRWSHRSSTWRPTSPPTSTGRDAPTSARRR